MILYHGSDVPVEKPDIAHSRRSLDFGKGFYTTPIFLQASKWAMRRTKSRKGAVSKYQCDEDRMERLKTLRFDGYSEQWLNFVVACRLGLDGTDYDIVDGNVADDRVFNTIELFTGNLISKEEALLRLKFEIPNRQICFRTQAAIDQCLKFEGVSSNDG